MVRLALFQPHEHAINSMVEIIIIFYFHAVKHIHKAYIGKYANSYENDAIIIEEGERI